MSGAQEDNANDASGAAATNKVSPEVEKSDKRSQGSVASGDVAPKNEARRWSVGSFDYPLKQQEAPRASFTFRRSESDLEQTNIHDKPGEGEMQGMRGAISHNSQRYEKRTGWYSVYYYYPRVTDDGVHKGAGDSFMIDLQYLEEYNKENDCLETIWSLDERFRKEIRASRAKGMDWGKFFRTRFYLFFLAISVAIPMGFIVIVQGCLPVFGYKDDTQSKILAVCGVYFYMLFATGVTVCFPMAYEIDILWGKESFKWVLTYCTMPIATLTTLFAAGTGFKTERLSAYATMPTVFAFMTWPVLAMGTAARMIGIEQWKAPVRMLRSTHGKAIFRGGMGFFLICVFCVLMLRYAVLDITSLARSEKEMVRNARPFLLLIMRKTCTVAIGFLIHWACPHYGMRFGGYVAFYIMSGIAGSVGVAGCEDWGAALRFQVVTILAWLVRVWAYTTVPKAAPAKYLKKYQILGKPTPIGRIRRSDLRGYELILEGFAQTVVYLVFACMIYPFGKFIHPDGENWRLFKFFFRTKDSILFVCMFLVVDFIQDSVDWAIVQRRTNSDFRRYFVGTIFHKGFRGRGPRYIFFASMATWFAWGLLGTTSWVEEDKAKQEAIEQAKALVARLAAAGTATPPQ